MIKSVLSGSFAFNDCVASIVPLHRTGVDGDWMAKRAAAPVFDFDKHTPRKGETLVHLLALGDGEVTGCNRNGDYFPKAANEKYHPTFLKACYFHHHDNKDPDKAFGRVVAAGHNSRMGRVELIIGLDDKKAADDLDELEKKGEFPLSMSCRVPFDICVPPESPILTEHGELPIEEVRVGDRVLTHTGVFKEVTKTFRRKFSGALYSFNLLGRDRSLRATETHPMFVIPRDVARGCRTSVRAGSSRHTFNGSDSCIKCAVKEKTMAPRWVAAQAVRVGDYAVFPRTPELSDTVLTEDECWLLGLYIGDGWPLGHHAKAGWQDSGVAFSLGTDHPETINKVVETFDAKCYEAGDGKHAIRADVISKRLVLLFRRYAGAGCKTKRFPVEALHWPLSKRRAVLAGMIDSDGSVSARYTGPAGVYCGTNSDIVRGFAKLCYSLGYPAAVCLSHPKSPYHANERQDCWYSSVPNYVLLELVLSEKMKAARLPQKRVMTMALVTDDYVGVPIKQVSHEIVEWTDVCNLAVEDDESYVANDVVVHNCSICHNKAASRKEYCKHASMMMGRIMDNGKQACVINDHPNFFDISRVFRGADRIAFTFQKLDKAASDGQVIGGAELAELLDISDVMVPVMRSANPDQKAATWQKMGQAADGRLSCFKSAAKVPEIPDEAIAALKSAGDLGAVFGALHTAGICLPVASFVRVAGISKPAEARDGDIQKRVRGLLSSVDAADVQKLSENGSYDGARRPVSTKIASIVAGLRVNNGFLPADAYSRILNQTARAGLDKSVMEKAAGEPSPKAAAIADEYAAYLLALAHENAACDHVEFVQNLTALHALG